MAIWPDASLRKSTSSGENGVSVVRKIDRIPRLRPRFTSGILQAASTSSAAAMSYLIGGAWCNEQLFLDDPLAVRKIHGKYPEFSRRCVGQRNAYGISVHDLAYVRRNRAQDLAQVEARRDSGGQIEEQLKPLVLSPKFGVCAHGRMPGIANLLGCDPNDGRFRTETASAGSHISARPRVRRARFHQRYRCRVRILSSGSGTGSNAATWLP